MSRTTRVMRCTPDDVFAVIADGWSYVSWVVGASRIRAVDDGWPKEGTRIHHSVGLWPVIIDDTTRVEENDAPNRLRLQARAWPTGEARIVVTCVPHDEGTIVTLEEQATTGIARRIPKRVQDAMLKARNEEALRRLSYLAEGRARTGREAIT